MIYLFDTITDGEKRFIERKKLRRSIETHAKKTGHTIYSLTKLEQDGKIGEQVHLELWEECVIYMRRNNIETTKLANEMGVTRATLCHWKYGENNYDRLFERLMDDKCSIVSEEFLQE